MKLAGKIIRIILSITIMFLICGCEDAGVFSDFVDTASEPTTYTQKFLKMGNSTGNLRNNFGMAAYQDDWIYYITRKGINKVHNDGSNEETIFSFSSWRMSANYLSVYDQWVYFRLGDYMGKNTPKFVRIKTDGSSGEAYEALYENVFDFQIVNDHFYYTNPQDKTLHRANLDKSGDVILIQHESIGSNLQIAADKIYFGNNIDLYEADINGQNLKCYKNAGSQQMLIYKGKKYSSGGLDCENIDGSDRVKLLERDGMEPVIMDDWIYFTYDVENKVVSPSYVYRMKIDGTKMQKINNRDTMQFAVVGDWIYYRGAIRHEYDKGCATVQSDGLYRIRIDGTKDEKIE